MTAKLPVQGLNHVGIFLQETSELVQLTLQVADPTFTLVEGFSQLFNDLITIITVFLMAVFLLIGYRRSHPIVPRLRVFRRKSVYLICHAGLDLLIKIAVSSFVRHGSMCRPVCPFVNLVAHGPMTRRVYGYFEDRPISMTDHQYDIVTIGDFRFPGGTSTAIAEELRAQAHAGYRTGLLQIKGPILRYPHPFHPQIRACIDEGLAELLDPEQRVSCSLILAHHPSLFANLPRRRLLIESEQRLLIAHHPPFDAQGMPAYDLERCAAHAAEVLGGDVIWAPVGPMVRQQLASATACPPLLPYDWHNVLDGSNWFTPRAEFSSPRPIIGRHSRPDYLKWPDDRKTTLEIYPDDPSMLVRILGGGPYLRDLIGPFPENWQVWAFNELDPRKFLGMIDFFVYFHHSHWVEAFGRTILEAMASGAVLVLPRYLEPLFGEGACYADPTQVQSLVRDLHNDRVGYLEQSRRAVAIAHEGFGPDVHLRRLHEQIGKVSTKLATSGFTQPSSSAAASPITHGDTSRRRVLFMTSNGVGMGHLVRMLAIAKRCSAAIQPIFLSMSQALSLVRKEGYLAEFLPFHRYLDVENSAWNNYLEEELSELITFYDPAVVVFDGNVPYTGLIKAINANLDPLFVWSRRGMWRPGAGEDTIGRERHFDAVIEPGELADAYDKGATLANQGKTVHVPPVRLLDTDEMLSREAARAALALEENRPAALMLLGSGNNFDFSSLRHCAIARLTAPHNAQIVIGEWLIAQQEQETDDGYQRLPSFPFSRFFKGFDLVISAVGYNSFHELLFAGVPTIFVPNKNPEMDDQGARGRFAERRGMAIVVEPHEVYRMSDAIDHLLEPAKRVSVQERSTTLNRLNGAKEAARLIEEMALGVRADY